MALNPRKEKCFNDYSKLEVGEGVPAKRGQPHSHDQSQDTESPGQVEVPRGNMGKKRRPGEIRLLANMKQ